MKVILTILLMLFLVQCDSGLNILFLQRTSIQKETLNAYLIGEFLFSNNPDDTSVVSGSITPVIDRFSTSNSSYTFTGSRGDFITISSNSIYDSSGTICFWIKTNGVWQDNSAFDDVANLITRSDAVQSRNGISIVMNSLAKGGEINLVIKNASATLNEYGSINIADNTWHFVSVTYVYSSNGIVTTYIDGVQDILDPAIPLDWSFNNQDIQIGESLDNFWETFQGQLDDIHIYDKVLTQLEVTNEFNSER